MRERNIIIVLILAVLLLAVGAFAELAPNGKKDVSLTVNSQTVNMSLDNGWAVYSPGACKFRTMSTVTKAGATRTIPAGIWIERKVNKATPFINFTGCTTGEVQRW